MRLRRDRTAMVSGITMLVLMIIALAAPLIEKLYGVGPHEQFQQALDSNGMPLGVSGGVTGEHWFGLEPALAGTSSFAWSTACARRCSRLAPR